MAQALFFTKSLGSLVGRAIPRFRTTGTFAFPLLEILLHLHLSDNILY